MAAPKNNKNAEKWTYDKASEFMLTALDYSKDLEYDFIGEIARDLNQYKEIFSYLVKMHPTLKDTHNQIITNLEANCYYNTKKGNINTAVGIVNLKSNHKWTDRLQQDNTGEQSIVIKWHEEKTYEADKEAD